MILPTKGIAHDRALITIGGLVLQQLSEPKTVSRLWEDLRPTTASDRLPFDWFVLSLDLLFVLGAVDLERGRLRRVAPRENES